LRNIDQSIVESYAILTMTTEIASYEEVAQQITSARAESLNSAISTKRLAIEPLNKSHAHELFALMQNSKIYEWISTMAPENAGKLAEVWAERETRLSPNGNEAWLNWAVKRTCDGAYVGKLDVSVDSENVATNVGYFFFPDYWGKGYASEAILALTKHLAAQGIVKMVATVTLGNVASYRVLEKAGFEKTRVIPENDVIRGKKYDDVEYVRVT
jgi:ribosomal-protein-alanine N-acetyltransferase